MVILRIEILSFRYFWYNLSLLLSVNVKVEWLPANIAAKVTLLISIGKQRDSMNDWRGKTSET